MEKREAVSVNWKPFFELIQWRKLPKLLIILVFGLNLIQSLSSLAVPWFTKNLVDVMSVSKLQTSTIILLVVAFIVQALSSAFSTYFLSYLGERVVANLRKLMWEKILKLPIPYFDQNRTGETVSRINNDTAVIKDLITNQLVTMFSSILSIIGSLAILLFLDWSMTLIMLVSVPIIFLVMQPIGKKMRGISHRTQSETAHLTSLLTQVISEIRLVKAYVAEPIEKENGHKGIEHLFHYGLKEAKLLSILQPLMGLIMTFMMVLIIGYGGMRVSNGDLTAGELVAFILYLFQIIFPISNISRFFTSLQKAMGATERLRFILDHEQELENSDVKTTINTAIPIQFDQVQFAYPNGETVLHDVSFTVPIGKVTAIVGPSGSGKTTTFSLLERFYQPTGGEIRLGDTPISQLPLSEWRSHFGYVSQESPLLAGTVRENICYAMNREVSEEELYQAAKFANAHEFIMELPKQYNTEVGERGIMLSGGQRQRIAIARALLHDPKILMLDEATSSLDSASEQVIQEALEHLMKGRTTLVIAHRLSTVVDADQIIVLEKGKLTGNGTHHQLIENHSLYRQLVEHQFKWELQKTSNILPRS